MTWLAAVPPAVVLALVLYVPGGVLALLFTRRRWAIVGFAPVISAGVLAVASLVSGFLGGHWGIPLVSVTTVATFGIFLVVKRLVAPSEQFVKLRDLRPWLHTDKWILLGALLNALIVGFMYIRPVEGADSILQIYDTPFHFSVIRSILESGDASSLHSASFDGTDGSAFYPALWHGWVALGISATGVSMPTAVNASVLVVLCLVWPLSAATLTTCLVRKRRSSLSAVAIGMSGLFGAFPWGFLTFGVLYSNLFSYSLAPAYLALLIVLISSGNSDRIEPAERWGIGIALTFGFVAFALAQPNSIFTLGVVSFPLILVQVWRAQTRAQRWGVLRGICAAVVLVVAAAVVWIGIYRAPFMQRTVTWKWDPFETPLDSVRAVLWLGMGQAQNQVLLGLLVVVGLGAISYRGHWWMVISYLFVGGLYVLSASVSSKFRDVATGFWYHDSTRLSAALIIMALPAAAIAVDFLGTRLALGINASTGGSADRTHDAFRVKLTSIRPLFALVIAAACALVLTDEGNLSARRNVLQDVSSDDGSYVNGSELSFMNEVVQITGTDAGIANNPFDGSTFGYSLYGLNVLFKSLPGNWLGSETEAQEVVQGSLSELGSNPDEVCSAIESLGVEYVLQLDADSDSAFYLPASWEAVSGITEVTPGFEEILREGQFALYKITGCS